MSNHVNDQIVDALQEAVDENVERATFLQHRVYDKLQDFDLEGAMDLVSHAVKSNDDFWKITMEDMKTTEHEENVEDHLRSDVPF